jgi:hypothetical protein
MAVIECPHCGAPVQAEEPLTVRSGHSASSGKPREWIMREHGDEIHRCSDAAA